MGKYILLYLQIIIWNIVFVPKIRAAFLAGIGLLLIVYFLL